MTDVRKRSQAVRTAETRALLLEAATSLLSERGFTRTTTAEIAQAAGVTTGALHHHFPTKEALFFAVLDDMTEEAVAQFRGLVDDSQDALQTADRLISSLWSVYGGARYWSVWEINIGLRSDPAMYDRIVAHRHMTMAAIEKVIDENVRLRTRTRRVLKELLPFILSSMRGIFLDVFMRRDKAFIDGQLSVLVDMLRREIGDPAQRTRRGARCAAREEN